MMTRTARTVLILGAGLLPLAACTTSAPALDAEMGVGFGDAVAHNTRAMAIAPTPAEAESTFIPFDRERRALAITAYREGTVPEPVLMRTDEE